MNLTLAATLPLLALAWVGCSENALEGTWKGPSTTLLGTTYAGVVALNGDLTASYTLEGSGACSGSLVYSGYTWVSDPTTITFSGTPTCSGAIKCGSLSFGCDQTNFTSTLGFCDYVLSADGDTLTTAGCSDTALTQTWTREPD
jgi:hypothetical protein